MERPVGAGLNADFHPEKLTTPLRDGLTTAVEAAHGLGDTGLSHHLLDPAGAHRDYAIAEGQPLADPRRAAGVPGQLRRQLDACAPHSGSDEHDTRPSAD